MPVSVSDIEKIIKKLEIAEDEAVRGLNETEGQVILGIVRAKKILRDVKTRL